MYLIASWNCLSALDPPTFPALLTEPRLTKRSHNPSPASHQHWLLDQLLKPDKMSTNFIMMLLLVFTALLPEGLLSVAHVTDDGMSILEPLEITDTHVVVNVPHLSAFGLIWDFMKKFLNITKPISGQVLLFLRPPNPKTQRQNLDVFLLPRNIPLQEVRLYVPLSVRTCLIVLKAASRNWI